MSSSPIGYPAWYKKSGLKCIGLETFKFGIKYNLLAAFQ